MYKRRSRRCRGYFVAVVDWRSPPVAPTSVSADMNLGPSTHECFAALHAVCGCYRSLFVSQLAWASTCCILRRGICCVSQLQIGFMRRLKKTTECQSQKRFVTEMLPKTEPVRSQNPGPFWSLLPTYSRTIPFSSYVQSLCWSPRWSSSK